MRAFIPNLLTASNLFCGLLAMLMVLQGQHWLAAGLIGAALLFDFFDGFVARLLHVSSPVGKELDSLADVVSFGVVPGLMLASMIRHAQGMGFPEPGMWEPGMDWAWMLGLLLSVFSALRLARFNLDTRQSDNFFGLPTPANTIFVMGLWLLVQEHPDWALTQAIDRTVVWMGLAPLLGWLLLANVRLLALKFKSFRWAGNEFRYLLVLGSVIFLVTLGWVGFPFAILFYLALSLIANLREHGNLSGVARPGRDQAS